MIYYYHEYSKEGGFNMSYIDNLRKLYNEMKLANGFDTDASFMTAWQSDPVRYAKIFSVRMALIQALSDQLF